MHNAGNTNYIFFFSLINGLEKEANGSGGGWGRTERYLSAPAAPAFSACIIHNHPPPPRTAAGRGFATMLLLSPCKNPFSQNTPLWHRSRGGGGDGDVVAALPPPQQCSVAPWLRSPTAGEGAGAELRGHLSSARFEGEPKRSRRLEKHPQAAGRYLT